MPGHYVFADSSGAVVIPDVQSEEALADARKSRPRTPRFATRSPASRFVTTQEAALDAPNHSSLAPADA